MSHEEEDRLTSLPSEIRTIILSFLPTKFAVTTAILSRPWRHIWTHITTLRFTITDFSDHELTAIFFIILRRVSWRHINTIELTIDAHPNVRGPSSLKRLIHDIVYNGTNIKNFKVTIENYSVCTISLPPSIFEKQSLEVLELYDPYGVSLKEVKINHTNLNLRKLVISIHEIDLHLFDNLLKSFPLLEILRVQVKLFVKRKQTIKLNSQNLKTLSVILVGNKEYSVDKNKIMVDTPKLQYFEVHSPIMVKFCFLKTPSGLLKAKLFMGDGQESLNLYSKHVLSVFNPILRVKTLKLSGYLLVALATLEVGVEVFHKLSHLEVGLSCNRSLRGVECFLQQCPNVECLVLKRTTCRAKQDDLISPDQIKFLPRCLHNKIERIELWNFEGKEIILQLMRHIFSVADALKKLDIIIQYNGESAILKKIKISQEFLALSKELPFSAFCKLNILLH